MDSHPYVQAFAGRNLERVVELLADDAVFHSPVITAPGFEGRASVAVLHEILFDAVTDVEVTHELAGHDTHVLIGSAHVSGKPIMATLLLHLNTDGKVREIWAMVRPLTGVVAISEAIGSQLAERRKPGRGRVVHIALKPLAFLAARAEQTGSRLITALNRSTA